MITRDQVLGHHSPALHTLAAVAAGVLLDEVAYWAVTRLRAGGIRERLRRIAQI